MTLRLESSPLPKDSLSQACYQHQKHVPHFLNIASEHRVSGAFGNALKLPLHMCVRGHARIPSGSEKKGHLPFIANW